LLARVLREAFNFAIDGYEEMMVGLMYVLELIDSKRGATVGKLENLLYSYDK